MTVVILSALAIVSAGLTAGFEFRARRKIFYVFKPLTMVLVILIALSAETPVPAAYKAFILAGLLFSLAGDVFLMFPEKWFQAGLVSFLVAQVLYILAFRPALSHSILLPRRTARLPNNTISVSRLL